MRLLRGSLKCCEWEPTLKSEMVVIFLFEIVCALVFASWKAREH